MEEIISDIKKLIVERLNLQVDPDEINDNEELFGGAMGLDSLATLEIIAALENRFDLEVSDEELTTELFTSIKTLAEYVQNKLLEPKNV
ncbi:acyl carrier protein [candidate division KSB1 bacterium]|nr:acyl carrier protein [candidate division KSB1 bacterium]